MKTRASIDSETGSTRYIGSSKSDRFCRVYRYHAPHPRHEYLRVEMIHRKEIAKQMTDAIIQEGIESAAEAAGASYSWKHELWATSYADRLPSWRQDTHRGGTLAWFYNAVVPAVKSMLKDGTLTIEEVQETIFAITPEPGAKVSIEERNPYQLKGS